MITNFPYNVDEDEEDAEEEELNELDNKKK